MQNFFEEMKRTIADQTRRTPGLVANLHGVIDEQILVEQATTSQNWFVLSATATKLLGLREFIDANSFQRLAIAEATGIDGTSQYPETGSVPSGNAVAFFGALSATGPAEFPIAVHGNGHQLAVYVDEKVVVTGADKVSSTVQVGTGQHQLVVIAYGATAPIRVELPPTISVTRTEPMPPAPILAGSPQADYLQADIGTYSVSVNWHNDAYASAWQVYRTTADPIGMIATVTDLGANQFEVVVVGAFVAEIGSAFFTRKFFAGTVRESSATTATIPNPDPAGPPTIDVAATKVILTLSAEAVTDPAFWEGDDYLKSREQYESLARVTYSGAPQLTYRDTTVVRDNVYVYRVTAFGPITGTAESDFSGPGAVNVTENGPPGDIVFNPATDVAVVQGELFVNFKAPSDEDYAGVKIFVEDLADPLRQIHLKTEFGVPGEPDQLSTRMPFAGTYWFRTFDTSGNIQQVGDGKSYTWDGAEGDIGTLYGTLYARVASTDDACNLELTIGGPATLFPATVEFFIDSFDAPYELDGSGTTILPFPTAGTIGDDPSEVTPYPRLTNISLPATGSKQFWAQITDAKGAITFAYAMADRGSNPDGLVVVEDFLPFPNLTFLFDEDVESIRLTVPTTDSSGTLGTVTYTRLTGGGMPTSGGGDLIYTVGELKVVKPDLSIVREADIPVDGKRGPYLVEYIRGTTVKTLWKGNLFGEPSNPPTLDAKVVLDATQRDAADLYVKLMASTRRKEQLTLEVKDEDDATLPSWSLVTGTGVTTIKYVNDGTELGPTEWFYSNELNQWAQKLNNIPLRVGQLRRASLRVITKDSGIPSVWMLVAMPIKEVPEVEAVDLQFNETLKRLEMGATAGKFTQSLRLEISDDPTYATGVTRTDVAQTAGNRVSSTKAIAPADRGKKWYGRAIPFNGPLNTGVVTGLGGYPAEDSEFINPIAGNEPSGTAVLRLDETGAVTLVVNRTNNTQSFYYVANGTGFVTTRTGGTTVNFASDTSTTALGVTLQAGQSYFVTVWFFEGSGGAGDIGRRVTDTVTFTAASPPTFDAVLQTQVAGTPNYYNLQVRISDPLGSGGLLKVWTAPTSLNTPNPSGAPDGTLSLSSTPAVVSSAALAALGNVRSNPQSDKYVFLEFIANRGATTGQQRVKMTSLLVDVGTDGKLSPGAVTPNTLQAGTKLIQNVTTLPGTGVDGDVCVLNGVSYIWYLGGWKKALEIPDLTNQITAAMIQANAVTVAKFASGIRPVELFASLPASGTVVGQVVYITADQKLYRWTGSAWTAAVNGADIVNNSITAGKIVAGSITSTQIAAGEIRATNMAADSIFSAAIQAGAVTANKITISNLQAITQSLGIIVSGKLTSADGLRWLYLDANPTAFNVLDRYFLYCRPVGSSTASFYVHADGSAWFNGTLGASTITALSLTAAQISVSSLQQLSQNMGIQVSGLLRGSLMSSNFLNLNANPATASPFADDYWFIKTPGFSIQATGTVRVGTNNQLSEMTTDLGTIYAGRIIGNAGSYLDLGATDPFLLYHACLQLRDDGSANFAGRVNISAGTTGYATVNPATLYFRGVAPGTAFPPTSTDFIKLEGRQIQSYNSSSYPVTVQYNWAVSPTQTDPFGQDVIALRFRMDYENYLSAFSDQVTKGTMELQANDLYVIWKDKNYIAPVPSGLYWQQRDPFGGIVGTTWRWAMTLNGGLPTLALFASSTNLRFQFRSDGTFFADVGSTTFSPKPPRNAATMTAHDWLEWAARDARKPVKPYEGIPTETHPHVLNRAAVRGVSTQTVLNEEMERYGKDVARIAIGTANWAYEVFTALKRATSFEDFQRRLDSRT